MKNSIYYTLRSLLREIIRGHLFKLYFYNIIKKNEYSRLSLEKYSSNRIKKIFKSLEIKKSPNIRTLLSIFPIITKKEVQLNPDKYISHKYSKLVFNYNKTSGTTGSPLKIKQSLECVQLEEAFAYRQLKWIGYNFYDKIVWLRGDLIIPVTQKKPPYWCMDYVSNKLMMSSYHISSTTCSDYINKLEEFNPAIIQAYPSSIYALALWLENNNTIYKGKPIKGILTSSEVLSDEMKQTIEIRFKCKVYDWYGQAERVAAIGTCEHGTKHLLLDYSYVEYDYSSQCQIIGTSYNNMAMPLIRYATGDFFEVNPNMCKCGRIFPVVKKVFGRKDKTIVLSNGRKITFLDHAFKDIPHMLEAQIIQKANDNFVIKIVVTEKFMDESKKEIEKNLLKRLGDVNLLIEVCESIKRGKNGKFEFIKVEK